MEPPVKRPVGRPRKTPKVETPSKPRGPGLRRAAERAKAGASTAKSYEFVVQPPQLMAGVAPQGVTPPVMAMDINPYQFAAQAFPGGGFPGFPYLAQLATRAEYRQMAAALSTEITREWITFTSKQDDDDDSNEKIKIIEAEFKRLNVRGVIQKIAEQDCYFGRGQIFLDIAGADRKTPLILDPRTVKQGSLERIVAVEAVWTTPAAYNALDPAAPDFYRPTSWFMLGQEVHASRLLTVVTRPLPDILKPAFNFGGMSLSQLAEPYVDNWLRTRQSVADLLNNFSITALATSMEQILQGNDDGTDLFARADLFTATRSNKGLMLLDKDREELVQVNVPLGGLNELQAQAQEHMCAVSRMPAIILTGISPSGLNASSDGEIRVFYDWIAAQQESNYRYPLEIILKAVQLSKFGEIDPDIGFDFNPLYQMTPGELADIRLKDSQSASAYIDRGVVEPGEVRERLARDPASGFQGLDTSVELVPPAAQPGAEDLHAALDAEFKESEHPRAANGQFGSGGVSWAKHPALKNVGSNNPATATSGRFDKTIRGEKAGRLSYAPNFFITKEGKYYKDEDTTGLRPKYTEASRYDVENQLISDYEEKSNRLSEKAKPHTDFVNELADYAKSKGVLAKVVSPSDSTSRYLYVDTPSGEIKFRIADHSQPSWEGDDPDMVEYSGGRSSETGEFYSPADYDFRSADSPSLAKKVLSEILEGRIPEKWGKRIKRSEGYTSAKNRILGSIGADKSVSAAQHRAMEAAANGKSTLGIPKEVGKEFVDADKT